MKKSGLADSPFFTAPTPRKVEGAPKGTEIFPNNHTDERMNVRTNEQMNERPSERSNVQDYRTIIRKSYDIFVDQATMIDEWAIKQQRKAGKHITKGEVMREIIDFFFQKKKT